MAHGEGCGKAGEYSVNWRVYRGRQALAGMKMTIVPKVFCAAYVEGGYEIVRMEDAEESMEENENYGRCDSFGTYKK